MTGYGNNDAGKWVCNCGKANTGKFCIICGSPRPAASTPSTEWMCTCGKANTGKFCIKCGAPRPTAKHGEAAEHRAAEEAAARKAAEAKAAAVSSAEADGNKGMLTKVAIGVAVLLLLIGAYFMFGRKKETPPISEQSKVETKVETKTDAEKPTDLASKEEKPMDPAARAEKLKAYAEAVKAANEQKRQDATSNEKIVFLVDDVQRKDNDLAVSGHFYNGKKNRTIIGVKGLELDIVLRDMDKEILNEKNVKYEKAFTGMNIQPLKDSEVLTVNLPGKAPAAEFNNFSVSVHDVHWEAVGK